jgi:hypothetical protein
MHTHHITTFAKLPDMLDIVSTDDRTVQAGHWDDVLSAAAQDAPSTQLLATDTGAWQQQQQQQQQQYRQSSGTSATSVASGGAPADRGSRPILDASAAQHMVPFDLS